MTPEERASAVAAAVGTGTRTFTATGRYGQINIQMTGCIAVGPAVWFDAIAWTGAGGNRVDLPVDRERHPVTGRCYFSANPPLQPQIGVDQQGNPIYTRNDLAAGKQIVYDLITDYAVMHGWIP